MKNILYDKKIRSKSKSFFNLFSISPYYMSEKIILKEKVYTFLYNMKRNGYTTKGEMQYFEDIMRIDYDCYKNLEEQFNKDYIEYLNNIIK